MTMITSALQRASKRKNVKGESTDYTFKVLIKPLPVGSYSFDDFFYYVLSQYHESSEKRRKVSEGKAEEEASKKVGSQETNT